MGTNVKTLSREDLKSYLKFEWDDFFFSLLYAETERDINYDKLENDYILTKDYFCDVANKGFIKIKDLELFEILSTFEYLPKIFTPEKDKDKFKDLCSKMTELRKSLESISK